MDILKTLECYIESKASSEAEKELKEKYDGKLKLFVCGNKVVTSLGDNPYYPSTCTTYSNLDEEFAKLKQKKIRDITCKIAEKLIEEAE